MREYELEITDLKKGLRPESRVPVNSNGLIECFGFRCGSYGLEGYEPFSSPVDVTIDLHSNWPFPQVIFNGAYRFLIDRDTTGGKDVVYILDVDYEVSETFELPYSTYGTGTLFEVVDFYDYVYITNGLVNIFFDSAYGRWRVGTQVADIPVAHTVCNFKGSQVIGGNISSSWHDCDERSVVWGRIGEMNFTPDKRNTAGFKPVVDGGIVYNTRVFNNSIIVYTSLGVTVMSATESTAWSWDKLHEVGIVNKGAVGGNDKQHLFVDTENCLWKLSNEGLQRLGYQEFISTLTGNIIINYESTYGDFYISGSNKCYLLANGLSQIPQVPSAVWNDRGIWCYPDTVSVTLPYLTTDKFDMGYRGSKTIFTIESGIENTDDSYIALDWIANHSQAFQTTPWRLLNKEAIASQIIAGTDFRLLFKCTTADIDSRVDYFKVRYKMTDLRGVRGVYAPPLRGQSR